MCCEGAPFVIAFEGRKSVTILNNSVDLKPWRLQNYGPPCPDLVCVVIGRVETLLSSGVRWGQCCRLTAKILRHTATHSQLPKSDLFQLSF